MDQPAEPSEAAPRPKSNYRGLSWDRKHAGWRVRIYYRSKQRHIGRYADEIEAAKAYDIAAYYLYGEAAITNFGIEPARAQQPQVSEFIIQAKQQVLANEQRHILHHHSGHSMALQQQKLSENFIHLHQQHQLYSTSEIAWQPQQQYIPVAAAAGSCSGATAATIAVSPNIGVHANSGVNHLSSPAADVSTLHYRNSACIASPAAAATAAAPAQLVVVPTPLGAQAGANTALAAPWFVDHTKGSSSSQTGSYSMGGIPTMVQQQQLQQAMLPAATAAGMPGGAAGFMSVPLPPGMHVVTSLPMLPPKLPLQQQQQHQELPQLYDTAGAMLWQAQQQQQQLPNMPLQSHQVQFSTQQGEPLQFSVQPQLLSFAGHMSMPAPAPQAGLAAKAATASQGMKVQQQQQQVLLEAQLQSMTLLDGSTCCPPASHAQQVLFSPQFCAEEAAPPPGAATAAGVSGLTGAATAAGVSGLTGAEELPGSIHNAPGGLPDGAGVLPPHSPFASSLLLQSGTQQQQQLPPQGEVVAGCYPWR